MVNTIKIEDKEEDFKWYETVWYYSKRFLRAVVPQLPAVYAYAGDHTIAPYLVLTGGILTSIDKFMRTKGWY